MDHDQNFKNLIVDYPRQALAFFAQKDLAEIDSQAIITPLRQEQLKEQLGDRYRALDVPLKVEWPDGRREALLFVLEEESDPRKFSIHRLAHYCLDLAKMIGTDRVVPVVIFLRTGDYPKDLKLGDSHHSYLQFDYLCCDLAKIPFEGYKDSNNIVARLNLPNMRYSEERKVEVYAQAIQGLLTLEKSWEKQIKYMDFIDIYANLEHDELQMYQQRYPQEADKMATFSERMRAEGMQQGMQRGEVAVLLRLMERKFGRRLTEDDRRRVESADVDTLLEWSDRILSANSVEEILH